jgi:hypothetical protein
MRASITGAVATGTIARRLGLQAGSGIIPAPLRRLAQQYADVAELVDALDLGSSAERCESSSLSVRTTR